MRYILFVAVLFSIIALAGCTETKEVPVEVEKTVEVPVGVSQEDYDSVVREINLANTRIKELEDELAALQVTTPSPIPSPTPTTNPVPEIAPSITIEPDSGPPGTTITLNGQGWKQGGLGLVTVKFGNATVAAIQPNEHGDIGAEFEVPQYSTAGKDYECKASDYRGNRCVASFNVTELSQKVLRQWSGGGIKTTEPFTITKSPWVVSWSFTSTYEDLGLLQIYVYNSYGDLVDLAANTMGSASDSSYIYKTGTFYLEIVSSNANWNVSVVGYP